MTSDSKILSLLRHPVDAISLLAVILLMRWAHLVEHNHAHVPIFHRYWLNEALGWLMFLNGGAPQSHQLTQFLRLVAERLQF